MEQTNPSWEPSLWSSSFWLCCADCWAHCYAPHIHYVWNWDQLGYVGAQSQQSWEERQRGPYVREPETGSSLDCGSLWFSPKAITLRLCLPPSSLPHWVFTKQEAKTPGWNNKGWTGHLSVWRSLSFPRPDWGHHKIHSLICGSVKCFKCYPKNSQIQNTSEWAQMITGQRKREAQQRTRSECLILH